MSNILLHCVNFKKRLMPVCLALALSGCQSLSLFNNGYNNLLKSDANANSDFYMNKISQVQNIDEQQTYKLLAARVLIQENKIPQAEALLAELRELNEEQKLDRNLITANIAAINQQNAKALSLLHTVNLTELSPSQQTRYYATLARIAENQNDVISAVKARLKMDTLITDMHRKQENNNKIWSLLRQSNKGLIASASAENDPALAGWLALANIYNNNIHQPTQLSQALQGWKNAYPSHSAAQLFPTELQGLFNFQQTNFSKVALLLPLTGNGQLIGNTVKSGFDDAKGNSNVSVETFDTANMSVTDAISQAKQNGAQVIVGPLLKNEVDNLLNNSGALQGLNVLTLNATSNMRSIPQLCYYGLSPEDEAESAANRIWKQGMQSPFVVVPQNDLGQRTASAFNMRWQQLAGTDANIKFYNQPEDLDGLLQAGLSANTQALYIVATSEQLSGIKTIIDNSNSQLKLYASSRSNSANNGPEYRLQMEGLQFSDIPFFKEMESAQYKKVEKQTNGDYSLMRLYAMGADAWSLISHFNEIRQVPGYNISGLTGVLSAGPNCNIERDMTWLKYSNGTIQVLN